MSRSLTLLIHGGRPVPKKEKPNLSQHVKAERPEWDKLDDDITRNTETLKDVSPVYVIGGAHAICTNCKKDFYKTPQWAYKLGSKYFCSYKCSREYKSGLKKKTNKLLDGKGAIK